MKNAPSASRQDAPVPRRSSATARTRPSTTSTGTVATRNTVSLRKSVAAAERHVGRAGQQEDQEDQAEEVAVPLDAAGQVRPALGGGQVVLPSTCGRASASASASAGSGCRRSTTGTADP